MPAELSKLAGRDWPKAKGALPLPWPETVLISHTLTSDTVSPSFCLYILLASFALSAIIARRYRLLSEPASPACNS